MSESVQSMKITQCGPAAPSCAGSFAVDPPAAGAWRTPSCTQPQQAVSPRTCSSIPHFALPADAPILTQTDVVSLGLRDGQGSSVCGSYSCPEFTASNVSGHSLAQELVSTCCKASSVEIEKCVHGSLTPERAGTVMSPKEAKQNLPGLSNIRVRSTQSLQAALASTPDAYSTIHCRQVPTAPVPLQLCPVGHERGMDLCMAEHVQSKIVSSMNVTERDMASHCSGTAKAVGEPREGSNGTTKLSFFGEESRRGDHNALDELLEVHHFLVQQPNSGQGEHISCKDLQERILKALLRPHIS
jgi:hypothetical protein